jgi:hypothetical protein
MRDDQDRVSRAFAENRQSRKQIENERRLMELIEEFRASRFKSAVLFCATLALLFYLVTP